MNSKNSRTSDPHRLLLSLSDKIELKRIDKYVAVANLSIYYTWENIKKSNKNNKFKYQFWHGMEISDILYQIFKITSNIS